LAFRLEVQIRKHFFDVKNLLIRRAHNTFVLHVLSALILSLRSILNSNESV
jgi:hypothetical protein